MVSDIERIDPGAVKGEAYKRPSSYCDVARDDDLYCNRPVVAAIGLIGVCEQHAQAFKRTGRVQ